MYLFLQRGDEKRNGDIVPCLPFYMRPTGMSLYVRTKVGRASLLRLAGNPFVPLNIKDVAKPGGEFIC